jgi:hypothetical protein
MYSYLSRQIITDLRLLSNLIGSCRKQLKKKLAMKTQKCKKGLEHVEIAHSLQKEVILLKYIGLHLHSLFRCKLPLGGYK